MPSRKESEKQVAQMKNLSLINKAEEQPRGELDFEDERSNIVVETEMGANIVLPSNQNHFNKKKIPFTQ